MRASLLLLAFLYGPGCTQSCVLSPAVQVGDGRPTPIGGGDAPPGGGLGPDRGGGIGSGKPGQPPQSSGSAGAGGSGGGTGALIDSGSYDLSAACTDLLSSPKLKPGKCSANSTDFMLPGTGAILNDPNVDICGISDGDIAYAVDECFSAACNGQLGHNDFAAMHDTNAQMYLNDAKDLCSTDSQSLGSVHCAFTDVWSCP